MKGLMQRVFLAGFLFCLVCLQALECHAQIGIKLETDRRKYLQYEPIRTRVLLRNYSANTLVFGGKRRKQGGSLHFEILPDEHTNARKIDPAAEPTADLILGAGETRELVLVLNSLYEMQQEGVYRITARLGHPRLPNDYRSEAVTVEVRAGLPIWNRVVGMSATDPTSPIQSRKASLLSFHEDAGDLYCLRVEDDEMVYGVVRLGARLGGVDPECDVDGVSNIHVLFQIRPRLYAYRVYDLDVRLKQEKYYLPTDSNPRLVRDPSIGRIMVTGGRAAVEGVDYDMLRPREPWERTKDAGTSPTP